MACQFLNSARSAGNNFDFPLYTFRIPRSFSFLLCVLCESLMFFAVNFSTFTISKNLLRSQNPNPEKHFIASNNKITSKTGRLGERETWRKTTLIWKFNLWKSVLFAFFGRSSLILFVPFPNP